MNRILKSQIGKFSHSPTESGATYTLESFNQAIFARQNSSSPDSPASALSAAPAPAAAAAAIAEAPHLISLMKDSGTRGDRITISANPFIRGSSLPGSQVHVVVDGIDNGAVLRTGGDGKFFGRLGSILNDGEHQIQLYYLDAQGHRIDGDVATIVIDRTRPDSATLESIGSDTGTDTGDFVTQSRRLILSGVGEAGTQMTLSMNNVVLATVSVGTGGGWVYAVPSDLADGTYELTMRLRDVAGNVRMSRQQIVIDNSAPDVPVEISLSQDSSSGDSVTNWRTQIISGAAGSAEAGTRIDLIDGNGNIVGPGAVAADDGSWSLDYSFIPLAYGSYGLRIIDAAGNARDLGDAFTISPSVAGTDGNDSIVGYGIENEILFGRGGDDTVDGGLGNDMVDGGDGNDRVLGGFGQDSAAGGLKADFVDSGQGDDVVDGGDGNDTLLGDTGNDTIFGDRDILIGTGTNNDSILGGSGNDVIDGGAGEDTINGGAGADTIIVGSGRNVVVYGADALTQVNAVDVILGFNANNNDFISLDALLDGLVAWIGASAATRANAVSITELSPGTGLYSLRLDADGVGGTFETLLATVQTGSGTLGIGDLILV